MDSVRLLVSQYLRAAWRRRWLGVMVAWLVCGVGWVGVYLIPNQYEASARLFVDADAVLTPLLRGLAADTAATSQLDILQRTLLSRPNMEKLISKTDLDLTLSKPSDRERMITRLSNEIRVTPQTKNLFTIAYRDTSPKLAYDVVQTLLTIFVESATGGSRVDMENAKRFLERQVQSYEQQLRAAERRRADFRSRYIDILPGDGNMPALEGARAAVSQTDGKLQDAILARDALKQELEHTSPLITVDAGMAAPGGGPAPRTRLQEAEEQLALLLLKDTENHPDVIAQRRLIEQLKKTGGGKTADGGKTLANGQRQIPNQVYDQLKVKMVDADTQVISLQRQRDEAVRTRDKLEKIQREQPGLLAEYESMDRDYSVLRKNYEELLSRLQAANIAQAADTQADKVKLQIIDPPEVPRIPVAPNRILLVTAVLIGGLAVGLGVTILLSQFDTSYSTVDELRGLGLPVLGGISVLGLAPLRNRLMMVARFGAAVAVLVCIYGGLLIHILRTTAFI
ncbi:XrtA system polysaccharide chain length determinant [Rhodopila sp.]|jgi:polysaccharide chain length determinant protein (PEP-CTERM system associated)|uniref:XrtA system polysaccharide chain length determinant n=1 Tax=Rhodopila sp. TaxID=2480087 RepID=UPI002C9FB123|nr:XrtA system polysaccharide chain length determinant [Rhodopila sp.]HVZ08610.1 XrtA system polysaccharide chain length determinant [Rhodopila sp.]